MLELVQRITGLESTYLTEVHWEEDVQEILFSRNTGEMEIPEGLEVPWEDTVCRRALESGVANTCDVPDVFGDSQAAKDLGIQTYVSVPVRTKDQKIFGTLCGASDDRIPVNDASMEVLNLFAVLIADQVDREKAAADDRARAEQAEERLRSRARFLAEASHMLKTPLTVIKGWSSLLANESRKMQPDQIQQGLKLIETRADELSSQIDDLLDEARTEVLASEIDLKPVDIRPVLERAAAAFGSRQTHPMHVSAPAESLVAMADERCLDQILGHLLENAIKYSPEGGTIELRGGESQDCVVLEVKDHGVGLPDGVDPFVAFQRGDEDGSRGIGLGLHIVKNLANAMGATVAGKRDRPSGSVFEMELRKPVG